VIDDSDYYVVIVGGRYGSIDPEGISYTELEYDYAVTANKPVLGFVHANPERIELGKSEKDDIAREKLAAFRAKVQERVCRTWATPEELAAAVTTSLHQLMTRRPGVGWIRGDTAVPPEVRAELAELRERVMVAQSTAAEAADTSAKTLSDESLQQGEDLFNLAVQVADLGVLQTMTFQRTWNYFFRIVGPLAREKTPEDLVRHGFTRGVAEEMDRPATRVTVVSSSYNQVMAQFEALGLLAFETSGLPGWLITPRGRRALAAAFALRRA
jgi:hypothetical protein